MAVNKPNTALRLIVPLVLVGVGVFAAWAVLVNTSGSTVPSSQSTPAADPAGVATAQQANQEADQQTDKQSELGADPSVERPASEPGTPRSQPESAPAADQPTELEPISRAEPEPGPSSEPEPIAQPGTAGQDALTDSDTDAPALVGLRARVWPAAGDAEPTPLGSIDPDADDALRLRFSTIGAGIASIRLADEFRTVADRARYRATGEHKPETHVEVQAELLAPDGSGIITPFAALWAEIDGALVGLAQPGVWRETAPGRFEAVIEDESGVVIARITRHYVITPGSLDIGLEQSIVNATDAERDVKLVTFGAIDLPQDAVTYGGDKRRVRFGYLAKPELDPSRAVVLAEKFLTQRQGVIGSLQSRQPVRDLWPNETSASAALELVWAGMTNRYFAVVVHADVPDGVSPAFATVEKVERVLLEDPLRDAPAMILRLQSPTIAIGAGGAADLGYRIYTGPSHEPTIREMPKALAAGVDTIVAYNFGGPCAACTFTWLTDPLLWLLRFLHSIVFDWSLAIVILVVCVRTVLHPVNRWSQIRVQRFGKQMQDLAPKQKKLQEKYKDDRQRMQQEMAKLWREEGINPAGMLGCLPMLLQSPIWIALYASLYFFYDLRHEPAAFGVIQAVTGGNWLFLADMAEPDGFIPLPTGMQFSIPLMGLISSVNVLPFVLAVVYFVHMKFMTPPTSATLSPEQEQTQKIAKYMMVGLFPIIMYNAPSGLAIYFIANSTIAILENTWIRAHIKKHDLLEVTKKPRKPRKKGGFMERLQQMAEQQQAIRQQQLDAKRGRLQGQPGRPGSGKGGSESAAQRAMRRGKGQGGPDGGPGKP
ncbi:MAG: membrane protein insertase YidC [Planctomycetota bacterium]